MIRGLTLNENTLGMTTPHQMINLYIHFDSVTPKVRGELINPDLNCRVYEMKQNQWVVIGQTETIRRSLSPCFETIIQTPYLFEQTQKLRIVLDDHYRRGEYEEFDEDMCGEFFCTVKDIILAENKTLKGKIDRYYPYSDDGRSWKKGSITIRAEKMQTSNRFARFKFSWLNVNNNFDRGCCKLRLCYRQRRRTYFTIKRQVPGTNKYATIYETDPIT